MPKRIRPFELRALTRGMEGISPIKGCELVEAAEVCLDHHQHRSGVSLEVTGYERLANTLTFGPSSDQARRTHADLQEATESGACAVAIVVVCAQTKLEVIERTRKGPGFDYWLGKTVGVLEARLEVSGILSGTEAQIGRRVKEKLEQMQRSDETGLPGYAAIVEFSRPRVHVGAK